MKSVRKLIIVAAAGIGLLAAGCSAGKPTQEEVRAGWDKIAGTMAAGVPGDMMSKLSDCVVPKLYNTLSDKALNAIAKGDGTGGVEAGDQAKVTQAATDCTKELLTTK